MVRNIAAYDAARQIGALVRQTLYFIGVVLSWTGVGLFRGAPLVFGVTLLFAPIAVIFSGHVVAGFALQVGLAVALFIVGPTVGGVLVEIILAAILFGVI